MPTHAPFGVVLGVKWVITEIVFVHCVSQEAQLPPTDRATRCISQGVVNYKNKLKGPTTNPQQIEVMEFRGLQWTATTR